MTMITLLLSIVLLMSCSSSTPRISDDELAQTASFVQPVTARSNDPAIEKWAVDLGGATVIGLGEATHGSHEIQVAKQQLFEALVKKHGVLAIGFEAPVGPSVLVDEYIQGGEGDARKLVAGLVYWVAATEAMVDLVEWMRGTNTTRGAAQKLHFFGYDTQEPWGTIYELFTRWQAASPEAAKAAAANFGCGSKAVVEKIELGKSGRQQVIEIIDTALTSAESVRSCRAQCLEAQTQAKTYRKDDVDFQYLAQAMCQWFEQIVAGMENGQRGGFETRDFLMASNVNTWRTLHQQAPIAISAHDYHLMLQRALPPFVGTLDLTAKATLPPGDERSMGYFLRSQLGSAYREVSILTAQGFVRARPFDVSTASARGEILANPLSAQPGSVEGELARVASDRFLVPLTEAAPNWLKKSRPYLMIGAQFLEREKDFDLVPTDSSDFIYFLRSTSAARVLSELEYLTP
jgi:erythromycin esterase